MVPGGTLSDDRSPIEHTSRGDARVPSTLLGPAPGAWSAVSVWSTLALIRGAADSL